MNMADYIPNATTVAFHGELWLHCPHCENTFEYWDAQFERKGIKKIEKGVFICPKCGKVFRIT